VVVTFICDTGNKYLSKVFDDRWMRDNGFLAGGFLAGGFPAGEKFGDLRDLIVNPASTGALISVAPSDSLASAFSRMRQGDVSQLPVIADGEIVGIIDESDVLLATQGNPDAFLTEAQSVMSSELVFVERTQNLEHVLSVLDQGLVALVKDELGFHGLITRSDVIAHLRNGYVKRQRGA
jgi:cystathionine beta-synthase